MNLSFLFLSQNIKKFIRSTAAAAAAAERMRRARQALQVVHLFSGNVACASVPVHGVYVCVCGALKKTRVEFQIILCARDGINNSGIKTFYTNSIDRSLAERSENVSRAQRECIGFWRRRRRQPEYSGIFRLLITSPMGQ